MRVLEKPRPQKNVFVYPLVIPTDTHMNGFTEVFVYRTSGSGWGFRYRKLMTRGDIWHPVFIGTERVTVESCPELPRSFVGAAEAMGNGEFGIDSPPFQFPKQRPSYRSSFIFVWRGVWSIAYATDIKPHEYWWPAGPAGRQLYGTPMSRPLEDHE